MDGRRPRPPRERRGRHELQTWHLLESDSAMSKVRGRPPIRRHKTRFDSLAVLRSDAARSPAALHFTTTPAPRSTISTMRWTTLEDTARISSACASAARTLVQTIEEHLLASQAALQEPPSVDAS